MKEQAATSKRTSQSSLLSSLRFLEEAGEVPVEDRLAPIAAWLKARPEAKIVVVGHSGVFDKLLLGQNMDNCSLVEDDLGKWP